MVDWENLSIVLQRRLGRDVFMAISKFLITVLHNIIINPTKAIYRKMKTTSKVHSI